MLQQVPRFFWLSFWSYLHRIRALKQKKISSLLLQDAGTAKRSRWLFAFGGHRGFVSTIPGDSKDPKDKAPLDREVKPESMLNIKGTRHKINVQSACLLPLRQLVLLGGDDGGVRVCT